MTKFTSVEEQVRFGLNTVDKDRTVEVSLRELIYVHNTLAELVRFFHNPMHFETLSDVEKFLVDKKKGAFSLICAAYYKKTSKMLPPDIQKRFNDGEFDNPIPPYYYKP